MFKCVSFINAISISFSNRKPKNSGFLLNMLFAFHVIILRSVFGVLSIKRSVVFSRKLNNHAELLRSGLTTASDCIDLIENFENLIRSERGFNIWFVTTVVSIVSWMNIVLTH